MGIYFFSCICIVITSFCYGKNAREYTPSSHELQLEIAELKHQIRTLKVDLELIEEKATSQKAPEPLADYQALQSRIHIQEKTIDQLSLALKSLKKDIQQILEHQDKTEAQLKNHENRLQSVSELKNTLTNLLKKMQTATTKTKVKSYRVQAKDSLEKIARLHLVSVEALKANNKLTSDTIFIGQELQIPHDVQ